MDTEEAVDLFEKEETRLWKELAAIEQLQDKMRSVKRSIRKRIEIIEEVLKKDKALRINSLDI